MSGLAPTQPAERTALWCFRIYNRHDTKQDQISTKRLPDDHDGTGFQP